MKKSFKIPLIKTLIFISVMILITNQMCGMEDSSPCLASSHRREELEIINLCPDWVPENICALLPTQIAFFDQDTVITDEFLTHINPEWQPLRDKLTQSEKNELLIRAAKYLSDSAAAKYFCDSYPVRRCLCAQLIALGADVNVRKGRFTSPILAHLVKKDDIPLIRYALKKINTTEIDAQEVFASINSRSMVQMFIAAGMRMTQDQLNESLYRCTLYIDIPLSLLNYYLEQGADPNYQNLDGNIALHNCSHFGEQYRTHYHTYIPSLLHFGARLDLINNEGNSIFHDSATQFDIKFCKCVINHLLKQYESNVAYLGCLKKTSPAFYATIRPFRNALFPHLAPLQKLKRALELKNAEGETAYEMSGWEILNPANCTYEKLKELLCSITLKELLRSFIKEKN